MKPICRKSCIEFAGPDGIRHVLDSGGIDGTGSASFVVLEPGQDDIVAEVRGRRSPFQPRPLGTGHAALAALPALQEPAWRGGHRRT